MPKTDDKDIWAAYARGVKPLGKRKKPGLPLEPEKETVPHKKTQKKTNPPEKKPPAVPPAPKAGPVTFDRRIEKNLRQGDIEIDARLDLHGMRQEEAHRALGDFIGQQVKAHCRCLLIITGKGRDGAGVLRSNLAGWLAASSHATRILALRPAAIRHGGAGAFYVLLKRPKN
jgi:DNA-nicking Smr family endonuclease